MKMPRPESKALGYLYDRFVGDDPERVSSYEEALTNAEVASAIYALRAEAGLSQRALAKRVGTTASVICRLEDADYEGHSLSTLRRVADAMGRDVAITFPLKKEHSAKKKTFVRRAVKTTLEGGGSVSVMKKRGRGVSVAKKGEEGASVPIRDVTGRFVMPPAATKAGAANATVKPKVEGKAKKT
jgi:hypothetical protein